MGELIMGMDLTENTSQISFYNDKTKDIESIPFWGSRMLLDNPKPMSDMVMEAAQTAKISECTLCRHIQNMLETACKVTDIPKIGEICVTLENFHITLLELLKRVFKELSLEKEVSFISHVESYCHYVITTRRELWGSGCVLMDFSTQGLYFYKLHSNRLQEGTAITVDTQLVKDGDIGKIMTGELDLEQGGAYIEKITRQQFDRQIISSVYLTGEKFDEPQLPKGLLSFLCSKRRVFAGQNLYVKGACVLAAARAGRLDISEFIFACDNRLTTTIEMDIAERGVPMRFRIAKAGMNWYEAARKFDCIINQADTVDLRLINLGAKEAKRVAISLEAIPYRPPKMTRLEMDFSFKGADRCFVTIKDKGFGDFYKSTGAVIHSELEL